METIQYKDSKNIRIDEYIKNSFPHLSKNKLYKSFRKKDIKVNGKRVQIDFSLNNGDIIDIYINKEYLFITPEKYPIEIVYEDKNILVINKSQGISVQNDKYSDICLIDIVRKYYKPNNDLRLCHRLDRNTGGLILLSKNKTIHDTIINEFNHIHKFYICYVNGIVKKVYSNLTAYLKKDSKTSNVSIFDSYVKNSKKISTTIRILSQDEKITKLEVYLKSGRTHQIRSHLAYLGFPIIGDGKYGTNKINKKYNLKKQALWAYKISFDFPKNSILNYLNSKKLEVVPNKIFTDIFNF
ncbi:MAG: RluA family pseudouridine synthase [Clostridiales bacterium]